MSWKIFCVVGRKVGFVLIFVCYVLKLLILLFGVFFWFLILKSFDDINWFVLIRISVNSIVMCFVMDLVGFNLFFRNLV